MNRRSVPRASVEYIEAVVVTVDDPSSATVQISLTPGSGAHTWLAAGWVAAATYDAIRGAWVRTARTTSPVTLAGYSERLYTVHVKVTAGAEAAVASAWEISLT